MRARKLLKAAVFVLLAVVAIGLYLIWFAPPLRPTNDYTVSYSVLGRVHTDARLFRPLGMFSRYYISIPTPTAPQYRWFVVDFSRNVVALPLFGVTCPFGSPCIHRDQALGIILTDPKTEDTWKVSMDRSGAHFSNATLSVSLTKNH